MTEVQADEIRDEKVFCYATAEIFSYRFASYQYGIRLLQFLGIVVPVSIGTLVLSYGSTGIWWKIAVFLAGLVSVFQVVASCWSLVFRWDENLAYALESLEENRRLSQAYADLEKSNLASGELQGILKRLKEENNRRSAADKKHAVPQKEIRRGHRAALRQFQIKCTECKAIPLSMKPTQCGTCGKF